VLKKAFLAFFNDGLPGNASGKPIKLLDLKICAICRYIHVPLRSMFFNMLLSRKVLEQ